MDANAAPATRADIQQLATLITSVKESLERDIDRRTSALQDSIDRVNIRLDKIAAGAHYVTRLAEWSEKQDQFQLDILRRVQNLESRVDKLTNQQ